LIRLYLPNQFDEVFWLIADRSLLTSDH